MATRSIRRFVPVPSRATPSVLLRERQYRPRDMHEVIKRVVVDSTKLKPGAGVDPKEKPPNLNAPTNEPNISNNFLVLYHTLSVFC